MCDTWLDYRSSGRSRDQFNRDMNKTPTHFRVPPKSQTLFLWNCYHWPVPNPHPRRRAQREKAKIGGKISTFGQKRKFRYLSKHHTDDSARAIQSAPDWEEATKIGVAILGRFAHLKKEKNFGTKIQILKFVKKQCSAYSICFRLRERTKNWVVNGPIRWTCGNFTPKRSVAPLLPFQF